MAFGNSVNSIRRLEIWRRNIGRSLAVFVWIAVIAAVSPAAGAATHKVIFDTDLLMPPQDDGSALVLALNSPDEIEVVGITIVAGNHNLATEVAHALRLLEIIGREEIPVYAGAAQPLQHNKSDYTVGGWGKWWSTDPAEEPTGGFATRKKLADTAGVDFIVKTVMENPREITILAVGPLTNIALAIRREPRFAAAVKRMVIMGGAIASLPDGGGNQTPKAEFNFWVDPEAAKIVLRAGIPITLSPLNVAAQARFTLEWHKKLLSADTAVTSLIKQRLAGNDEPMSFPRMMWDQLATATLIDPTLFKIKELYVDVDTNQGDNYGASVGTETIGPGMEGARKMHVEYDVDAERFNQLYVERMTRSRRGK